MQIANRESFAAAARRGWQNPYVTDGLAAMWDGEWNAGGGIHDASATTWENLVEGSPFGTWDIQGVGADYVTFASAAQLKSLSSFTVPATIELSIADWTGTGGAFLNFGDKGNWNSMSSSGLLCPYRTNTSGTVFEFYSKQTSPVAYAANVLSSTFAVFYSSSGIATCQNGGTKSSKTVSNNSGYTTLCIGRYASKSFTGKVRFVRFYSRVLTAAEIAANYAIDKERFGLT